MERIRPVNGPTSEELMSGVRDGAIAQLRPLFERHHRGLFGYFYRLTGRREVAEDLTQDVFFRLLKFRSSYQARGDFNVWLYRVAHNVWADHGRQRKRESGGSSLDDEPVASDPGPLRLLEQQGELALLRRALDRLPAEKREVLVLSRFHGLKYEQIAQLVGCSLPAVRVRAHRALKQLRDHYIEFSVECL